LEIILKRLRLSAVENIQVKHSHKLTICTFPVEIPVMYTVLVTFV